MDGSDSHEQLARHYAEEQNQDRINPRDRFWLRGLKRAGTGILNALGRRERRLLRHHREGLSSARNSMNNSLDRRQMTVEQQEALQRAGFVGEVNNSANNAALSSLKTEFNTVLRDYFNPNSGIGAEDLDRLFREAFTRLDSATQQDILGTSSIGDQITAIAQAADEIKARVGDLKDISDEDLLKRIGDSYQLQHIVDARFGYNTVIEQNRIQRLSEIFSASLGGAPGVAIAAVTTMSILSNIVSKRTLKIGASAILGGVTGGAGIALGAVIGGSFAGFLEKSRLRRELEMVDRHDEGNYQNSEGSRARRDRLLRISTEKKNYSELLSDINTGNVEESRNAIAEALARIGLGKELRLGMIQYDLGEGSVVDSANETNGDIVVQGELDLLRAIDARLLALGIDGSSDEFQELVATQQDRLRTSAEQRIRLANRKMTNMAIGKGLMAAGIMAASAFATSEITEHLIADKVSWLHHKGAPETVKIPGDTPSGHNITEVLNSDGNRVRVSLPDGWHYDSAHNALTIKDTYGQPQTIKDLFDSKGHINQAIQGQLRSKGVLFESRGSSLSSSTTASGKEAWDHLLDKSNPVARAHTNIEGIFHNNTLGGTDSRIDWNELGGHIIQNKDGTATLKFNALRDLASGGGKSSNLSQVLSEGRMRILIMPDKTSRDGLLGDYGRAIELMVDKNGNANIPDPILASLFKHGEYVGSGTIAWAESTHSGYNIIASMQGANTAVPGSSTGSIIGDLLHSFSSKDATAPTDGSVIRDGINIPIYGRRGVENIKPKEDQETDQDDDLELTQENITDTKTTRRRLIGKLLPIFGRREKEYEWRQSKDSGSDLITDQYINDLVKTVIAKNPDSAWLSDIPNSKIRGIIDDILKLRSELKAEGKPLSDKEIYIVMKDLAQRDPVQHKDNAAIIHAFMNNDENSTLPF